MAGVWAVFRLYQPVDYLLCTLISVGVFILGKAIFPDKSYHIAQEEEEREAQKRAEEAHAAGKRPRRSGRPGRDRSRRRRPGRLSRPRAPETRNLIS